MRYFIHLPDTIRDYIAGIEGFSAIARDALFDGIEDELGRGADTFLARDPLGHESLHFHYEYVQPGNHALYIFKFTVDGTNMAAGVVTVVFAECEVYPPS